MVYHPFVQFSIETELIVNPSCFYVTLTIRIIISKTVQTFLSLSANSSSIIFIVNFNAAGGNFVFSMFFASSFSNKTSFLLDINKLNHIVLYDFFKSYIL